MDVGARFRTGRVASSLAYFNNTYHDFISTEVVANSPAGSISQAINLASVRIQGVEAEGNAPFVAGRFVVAPSANIAWNYGTVLAGTTPLSGESLAGQPQDNITPWKIGLDLRVGDRRARWWATYGLRTETEVTRISPLLADSPFLIAQDLFGLTGFTVQRLAFGYDWRKGGDRHRPHALNRQPGRHVLSRAVPVRARARPVRDDRGAHPGNPIRCPLRLHVPHRVGGHRRARPD